MSLKSVSELPQELCSGGNVGKGLGSDDTVRFGRRRYSRQVKLSERVTKSRLKTFGVDERPGKNGLRTADRSSKRRGCLKYRTA